jgi:hypothetical protein
MLLINCSSRGQVQESPNLLYCLVASWNEAVHSPSATSPPPKRCCAPLWRSIYSRCVDALGILFSYPFTQTIQVQRQVYQFIMDTPEDPVSNNVQQAVQDMPEQNSSMQTGPIDNSQTFQLPDWEPAVMVTHPPDITKDQIINFSAFKTWSNTLKSSLKRQKFNDHEFHEFPYSLKAIKIQSHDVLPSQRVLFIKFLAIVENSRKESIPGVVFLRGGSVAVLIIVR